MHNSKTPSNRQFKVGEELRHAIADVFMRGELHSHEIDTRTITVSEVRISPDLKNATVYVMPLAGAHKKEIIQWLTEISPYTRSLIGKKMYLRHIPRLKFVLDETFEVADKINTIINSPAVKRDLE